MESTALDFFVDRLGAAVPRSRSIELSLLYPEEADLAELESSSTSDEVWKVISSMPTDKAPGPDGFSLRFFQSCWQIVKVDVMAAISALFYLQGRDLDSLNQALIVLIPKVDAAVEMSDFWPISLGHCFCKVFSKLLAAHLRNRLSDLVCFNQSAFICGHSIQDNYRAHGSVKALHRRKIPALFLKLDIAGAFDSVAWPFLLEVLRARGFGP